VGCKQQQKNEGKKEKHEECIWFMLK